MDTQACHHNRPKGRCRECELERELEQTVAQHERQVAALHALLREAQSLGLTFDIGSAYISRSYISHQNELNARIDAALKA